MNSITNILITELKKSFPNIKRDYPLDNVGFPVVVVTEGDLSSIDYTFDSGGFHHNLYSIEFSIFTKGARKREDAFKIRNDVNSILEGKYKMSRVFSREVPNLGDLNIYCYKLIYNCVLDKNKTIFGR